MKRHFLMLAHKFEESKHDIGGWFASEKLDGMRAFWDGGITRGMELSQVPWANTEKDSRYRVQPRSTGLWSRYGKSIQAPDSWLDKLPAFLLDGELWMGEGQFQRLISATKQLSPGPEWNQVQYKVFDMPPSYVMFANGEINETNFKKVFTGITYTEVGQRLPKSGPSNFSEFVEWSLDYEGWNSVVNPLQQTRLVMAKSTAMVALADLLKSIEEKNGEGLMLRHPKSRWVPQRSHQLLKVKSLHDAEATVVGYTSGRETDLGSKLLGLMGALIVQYKGKEFELSGFTDSERRLEINGDYIKARDYCAERPGTRVDAAGISNPSFPIGSRVSFKFRELTVDGKPKEARYWRKAE